MQRILIGYDGSHGGEDAIALGLALASPATSVTVATTYAKAPFLAGAGFDEELQAGIKEQAAVRLERARPLLSEHPDAHLRLVLGGSPAEGLHRLAYELEPDVLVVGASHHGVLGRITPGSVTEQTLQGSPCPVAVAPPNHARHAHAVQRIAAAYDGSPSATQALELAGSLARDLSASIVVIDVIDESWPLVGAEGVGDILEEIEQTAAEHLRDAQRTLTGVDHVTVQTRRGFPAVELAEASEGVDLLVLGSRGFGPLKRLLLGSVSAHLVRHAASPVLVGVRAASTDNQSSVETPAVPSTS